MSELGINISPESLILFGFALGWFVGLLAGGVRLMLTGGKGNPPL